MNFCYIVFRAQLRHVSRCSAGWTNRPGIKGRKGMEKKRNLKDIDGRYYFLVAGRSRPVKSHSKHLDNRAPSLPPILFEGPPVRLEDEILCYCACVNVEDRQSSSRQGREHSYINTLWKASKEKKRNMDVLPSRLPGRMNFFLLLYDV